MAAAGLHVERAGVAVWCTLDRPPLNLLDPGVIHAVRAAFDAFAADRATRVVVLTGSGRAFTAGMGVRPLPGRGSEEHTSELPSLAYLVCRLLLVKKKKRNS